MASERKRQVVDIIESSPASSSYIASMLGVKQNTVRTYIADLRDDGFDIASTDDGYLLESRPESDSDDSDAAAADDADDDSSDLIDLSDVTVADDADPDPSTLTDREELIAGKLQSGATVDELADELDERQSVVTQHIRDLKSQGWQIYVDETADHIAIEGDEPLRSSEHTGTRTRKANQWWETRHNAVVRRWKALDTVSVDPDSEPDREDWNTHITDLHAGDRVRGYDDETIIHRTEDLPAILNHITERSIALARKHNSRYDCANLLYGGDFVTNSGIYEGQFENLDHWLDEQVDILHDPLMSQIKTFSRSFDSVRVICQPGNHGDIRASGSSKQANADLILYKSLRNAVGQLQQEGLYENVGFDIGRAGSPTVVDMRGGEIHAQLRHGQDRSPQADTSARKKEWLSTILDSMNYDETGFDVGYMGHHHVSGRLPWNGPPVFITGTPKPAGEYPRKLGEMTGPGQTEIAHCHGLSDDGITGVFPIDERNLEL